MCQVLLYNGAWADQRLVTVLQISYLQMVCNTVMSLIKNSVCLLINQRPKAVLGYTFNEKRFPHN